MRPFWRLAKLVPKTEVGAQKIFPRKITFVLTRQNTFVIIHPMPQRKLWSTGQMVNRRPARDGKGL